DGADTGLSYLGRPEIFRLVTDAIHYGESPLGHYTLHAYVVMPNHVHLLITPHVAVPTLLRSLKTITARRANCALALTGQAFWQEESYDHWVRNQEEFERIRPTLRTIRYGRAWRQNLAVIDGRVRIMPARGRQRSSITTLSIDKTKEACYVWA
ncbi:MAG TPA: transposase, partial [Anaerolineales bacterium]|nr:transposase [Anaerolineales bacterium]